MSALGEENLSGASSVSAMVLVPALDSIIMTLSDRQRQALRLALEDGSEHRLPLGVGERRFRLLDSERTTATLVQRLLAWEPGTTSHRAELTPLGRMVAQRLAEGGDRAEQERGGHPARPVGQGRSIDAA